MHTCGLDMVGGRRLVQSDQTGYNMKHLESRNPAIRSNAKPRLVSKVSPSRPEAATRLLPAWAIEPWDSRRFHITSRLSALCSSFSSSWSVFSFVIFTFSAFPPPLYCSLAHSSRSARHELAALSTGSSFPISPLPLIPSPRPEHRRLLPPDMTPIRTDHLSGECPR